MNILTDPAPKTVTIGGAEVPINSDFRASVRFEMMMEDSSLSELDKTVKALSLYYDTDDLKNSFKPPAPIEAVSYTHLDVYKRQPLTAGSTG